MKINIVSIAGLAALLLAPVISGYAFTSPDEASPDEAPPSPVELKKLHNLEEAFSIIESIPKEVCDKGEEEAHKWVQEHYQAENGLENGLEKRGIIDIGQCAWQLINNLPALRAARLIKILGGPIRAARRLLEAVKNPRKRVGALKELINLIFRYRAVKKECWDDFRN
ncbi:MAG: hypothetical protein M1815_001450 [Lichina confinis]|nr:MAG: hypothetical protein M1815_001450 [Lichina confinis]